jgi:hypothetical protein
MQVKDADKPSVHYNIESRYEITTNRSDQNTGTIILLGHLIRLVSRTLFLQRETDARKISIKS